MLIHNFDIEYLHLRTYADYVLMLSMSGNILSRDWERFQNLR